MRLPGPARDAPDPLRYELLQEMAASLGRAGRRLERALAALAACDDPATRQPLVEEAATALWHLVVQREACGLRDTAALLEALEVPRAVRLAMGTSPRRNPTG